MALQNIKNAGLRTALDWLLPYAAGEKKWEYQQISKYNKNDICPLLLQAAIAFKDEQYAAKAKQLSSDSSIITDLLFSN
ncbi:MAG: hypothetical protein WDO16_06680 [Bacteroidota bacterium]